MPAGIPGSDPLARPLSPETHAELRSIARGIIRRGSAGEVVGATSLAHLAFAKGAKRNDFQSKSHFLAVVARAMRHTLIDLLRERSRRGGRLQRVSLTAAGLVQKEVDVDVLDLDAALTKLSALDDREARIVELKYFGGLTTKEIAEAVGVAVSTVESDWRHARAWLGRQLRPSG